MNRAEYLLRNLPGLWTQFNENIEDALEGSSHGVYVGIGRGHGSHSDPTARRAGRLYEVNILAGDLALVRKWIDTQLNPGDRLLLLAMWRQGAFGWFYVARTLRTEAGKCKEQWSRMCKQLEEYLGN